MNPDRQLLPGQCSSSHRVFFFRCVPSLPKPCRKRAEVPIRIGHVPLEQDAETTLGQRFRRCPNVVSASCGGRGSGAGRGSGKSTDRCQLWDSGGWPAPAADWPLPPDWTTPRLPYQRLVWHPRVPPPPRTRSSAAVPAAPIWRLGSVRPHQPTTNLPTN